MDWDEAKPRPKAVITMGEDLSVLSIGELDERVAALKAEIGRTEAAAAVKKLQQEAAAALFKQ